LDRVGLLDWDDEKNRRLRSERGVSFEEVARAIEEDRVLDVLEHPNPERYPRQRLLVVEIEGYAFLVPFVQDGETLFLKTIIPSRRATRMYLKRPS
jgi:uncharacterized DUF497 family protein